VLWALALAVVVLAIASWVAFSTESDDITRLGDPSLPVAPGLGDVPDKVGQPASSIEYVTFDGRTTSLSERSGRPMVVNFWASYCTPCITEMPTFEAMHQRFGDQVDFVGLAVNDGETRARELAQSTGVTYDLGFDAQGQIILDSGGVVLPTTVFIGADGTIVETHNKPLDDAGLQQRIEQHFGVTAAS
jgi:thiol-disulfide isomerase/thioredoxin